MGMVFSMNDLSPGQAAVVRLVAQGLSNRDISESLGIAEGTVKVHVRAIFKKMGVRNRTSAALTYLRMAAE